MFQERIREHYAELTPGFRKLADFITVHTLDMAFLTTTGLARRVGVDQATVVRFSQTIGYSGYRELSRELHNHVLALLTTSYQQASESQTAAEMAGALAQNTIQHIQQGIASEAAKLGQAAEILNTANHIWLVGEGISYPLAGYLRAALHTAKMPATLFQPSLGESADVLAQMEPGDALVTISIRNPSIDSGYVVRLAREKGVKTITFTDFGVGLPDREAELTISADTTSPIGIPSVGSLFTLLSIMLELLINSRPQETAQALNNYHSRGEELLALRAETYAEDINYFEG
ncbi:MAG: MurR/RpiR family transcriptional regulator [Chloroflexota bacterium]|nr:MurR/RpiR family transcriptional regulator [Chloroflexota bacterium]